MTAFGCGGIYKRRSDGRYYVTCRQGCTTYARVVLEGMLGRPLRADEQAHHVNGDPSDDRPENLSVVGAAEHQRLHGHSWRTSLWGSRLCSECGCDHDLLTETCTTCRMRHRARRRRLVAA